MSNDGHSGEWWLYFFIHQQRNSSKKYMDDNCKKRYMLNSKSRKTLTLALFKEEYKKKIKKIMPLKVLRKVGH